MIIIAAIFSYLISIVLAWIGMVIIFKPWERKRNARNNPYTPTQNKTHFNPRGRYSGGF